MNGNQKKNLQLGEPYGTANAKLRKSILFNLLKKHNENICFHCKKEIEKITDLSIEHKIPWLDSENPIELFYDLNNIEFSHLHCNCSVARKPYKILVKEGYLRCKNCKQQKLISDFPPSAIYGTKRCRECCKEHTRKYRKNKYSPL